MKNAKELLEEFTAASFRDPKKAAEMFTEDGAFEMPYLESFGLPGRYEGREAIEGFFRLVRELYPDMDLENIKVMIDTPEQAFAEYEFTAQSSKTGRTIHELFLGVWSQRTARSSFFANQSTSLSLLSASSPMGSPTIRFRQNTRHNAKGRGECCFAKSSLRQLLTITAVDAQCDGSSPVHHSSSQMSSSFAEFWPKQWRPRSIAQHCGGYGA
jgi:uncharacterized protein